MSDIAELSLSERLSTIQQINSVEEILDELKKIKALKEVLKSVGTFREQSVKFARLHAEALIRAVELDGVGELHSSIRKVAQWLYDCTLEDREKFISMCEEGLTIENIYKREVKDVEKMNFALYSASEDRKEVLETVKSKGIVDLTEYIDNVHRLIPSKDLAKDLIDGTRNRLKSSGAIGVGNDSHVYVMPNSGNTDEIKQALIMRYESISNDFSKIADICAISKVKMEYTDFEENFCFKNWNRKNCWMPHVLLALARMGLISEEAITKAIAQSDFSKEVESAGDLLRISRAQYIEMAYKNVQCEKKTCQSA